MGTYSDPALILPGCVGQTELDAASKKGVASGVAELDASGGVPYVQLPGDVARKAPNNFIGNNTINRAVSHGLNVEPIVILLVSPNYTRLHMIIAGTSEIHVVGAGVENHLAVTPPDATNFYVGNATSYGLSGNESGAVLYWVAIA